MSNSSCFVGRQWLAAFGMSLVLAACGGGHDSSDNHQGGPSASEATLLINTITGYAAAPLSSAETVSLNWVREEEKLAHDVYVASAAHWGLQTFTNIGASETMHMDAMKALLDRYQLVDPVAGLSVGQFQRIEFQALYQQLSSKSAISLIDALQVGLEIEELDIRDIERDKALIDNADILYAYNELLRGSRNHLRAFWKQLQQRGGSYTPQYLSQAQFDAIASSPAETLPTTP